MESCFCEDSCLFVLHSSDGSVFCCYSLNLLCSVSVCVYFVLLHVVVSCRSVLSVLVLCCCLVLFCFCLFVMCFVFLCLFCVFVLLSFSSTKTLATKKKEQACVNQAKTPLKLETRLGLLAK